MYPFISPYKSKALFFPIALIAKKQKQKTEKINKNTSMNQVKSKVSNACQDREENQEQSYQKLPCF